MKLEIVLTLDVSDDERLSIADSIREDLKSAARLHSCVRDVSVAAVKLPLRPLAKTQPTPILGLVDLSLLLIKAATTANIPLGAAKRFLDELVALPNDAARRILEERMFEAQRRANVAARREAERAKYRREEP